MTVPAPLSLNQATVQRWGTLEADEAAGLGTDVLVLVCGGMVGRDLAGSRAMVEAAIAGLAPHVGLAGVRLGIEPLHPMFAADRSVVSSLAQALGIVGRVGHPAVGVVVDAYHVWWEEDVHGLIERASPAILGFHVDDWLVPPPDVLLGPIARFAAHVLDG